MNCITRSLLTTAAKYEVVVATLTAKGKKTLVGASPPVQRLLQERLLYLLVQVAHVDGVVDHPNIPHGYIRGSAYGFCCCCCPQR